MVSNLSNDIKRKQPERDKQDEMIEEYERINGKVETSAIIKRGDELKRNFSINAEGEK